MKPRTLFDKIWDHHVVCEGPEGSTILYVDLHLVHEVTSPQAFAGLREAKRKVRRRDLTFASLDHNIPTTGNRMVLEDALGRTQVETLRQNCREFGVRLFDLESPDQGIVHVIGPELGLTQPGMTIVCGDSHTSTHGAFGALAFGIGTSEVEHVLATQCLVQKKPKTMLVRCSGMLAMDVTRGTHPGMAAPVNGEIPDHDQSTNDSERGSMARALEYMGLRPHTRIEEIALDRVFIGSCTNARLEDIRAAARVIKGYRISKSVQAMVVPGSQAVKRAAEQEGLHRIFTEAGFEWRESGCSMCLGMNSDRLQPGERCASTSNRNFEGRQGAGGRTHLVSPPMAATAAVAGHFVDIRRWHYND